MKPEVFEWTQYQPKWHPRMRGIFIHRGFNRHFDISNESCGFVIPLEGNGFIILKDDLSRADHIVGWKRERLPIRMVVWR